MSWKTRRRKKMIERTSIHHRKPRSLGGSSDNRNLSKVDPKQHQAFHTLFENSSVYEIASILNRIWLDPDYHIDVIKIGERR